MYIVLHTDDVASNDHSIAFRLEERSEAVSGGDLEDRRWWRGRRPGPGSRLPGPRVQHVGDAKGV